MLEHLRESFSLSEGEATPYRFLLIHYILTGLKLTSTRFNV
ncbi:hypothetical protein NEILACOT_05319 [Neisseria lactamica ATCC 23970]|uniref:Uncharacterized protein n=1 Tax=Neisseria lactamica ATCC 23970 TaxID=546265 RepID=D0WCN7_NEILA|nr:hypothetical protein NEILACOT_05319 [Neisseria lactamica ATCC 23970]